MVNVNDSTLSLIYTNFKKYFIALALIGLSYKVKMTFLYCTYTSYFLQNVPVIIEKSKPLVTTAGPYSTEN